MSRSTLKNKSILETLGDITRGAKFQVRHKIRELLDNTPGPVFIWEGNKLDKLKVIFKSDKQIREETTRVRKFNKVMKPLVRSPLYKKRAFTSLSLPKKGKPKAYSVSKTGEIKKIPTPSWYRKMSKKELLKQRRRRPDSDLFEYGNEL